MTLETLAAWLRCPHCQLPLSPAPPLGLRCPSGHAFDVNKRGYLTVVPPGHRMIGDSGSMLDARAAFLAAGHYRPIRQALATAVPAEARRIVDTGCGTGYYLAGVLEAVGPDAAALATDLSPEAVRRTVRATGADGVVADTWLPWAIRDAGADLVIAVFAPRNLAEMHRSLAPGGLLVVVVPTADHLAELRASGRAIDVPADKAERLVAESAELFDPVGIERVEFGMDLSGDDVDRLVGMGPSAHHRSSADAAASHVTASVDVLRLRKR